MKRLISFVLRYVPRKYLQKVSGFLLKVIGVFYAGNNVECPIIQKTYRKFLPYGRLQPRENALCPGSQSLERHRLLWLYLKEKTDFFSRPISMLHIAPEVCFQKVFKKLKNIDYLSADLESPLADIKLDVHDIPFEEGIFDVVFCNHVMEHVEDDIKAMKEIFRVLKAGGWAIIQSPINDAMEKTYEDKSISDPREREIAFGQNDHVRMYGKDYPERLRSAGFEVIEDHYAMQLPKETLKRYALPENEIIYLCKKT